MSKPNLVKIGPKYSAFYMQTYVWFIVTGEKKLSTKAFSPSEIVSGLLGCWSYKQSGNANIATLHVYWLSC